MAVPLKLIRVFSTIILLTISWLISEVSSYQVGNNPFRRTEIVDPEGKYLLVWEVDWSTKRITFNVTVETTGWVGLGLSNDETSSWADMVVGGVYRNGEVYFSDRHTIGESTVSIADSQQDWKLHYGFESETHTLLCFSRALDTCDPEDYELTDNSVTVRWTYGGWDNEEGYGTQRAGSLVTYLLDPDYAPEIARHEAGGTPSLITAHSNDNILPGTKVWSVQTSAIMNNNATIYTCAIHKAPRLQRQHHFIGYDIHFPNEESRLRTHHMLLYRCHPPPGVSHRQMFQPHVGQMEESCYLFRSSTEETGFPGPYCTQLFTSWAIGGKAFFLPNHVGFPFGVTNEEYYLIQLHYNNPQRQAGIQVDVRFDFFYTHHLRPHEGGHLDVLSDIPGPPENMLIPPNSREHRILAHCSPQCTQPTGIRVRHFRGDRELPWIMYDDNYDSGLQPIRHLREEVRVMPGDQLTVECHYATNETSVVGAFDTRQEMCIAFFVHYERIRGYSSCASGLNSEMARYKFLGIQNVSWVESQLEWVVTTPQNLAGLTVSQVSDNLVDWSREKRKQLQRFHEVHPQVGVCGKEIQATDRQVVVVQSSPGSVPLFPTGYVNTEDVYTGPVSYPFEATPYSPPQRTCNNGRGWQQRTD